MARKKTKGKQKIPMKKIEKVEDKLSTFSKRRSGIYKKLNDLIITCDAEIGFLMFTEAETPFSFGHPSMEMVYDKLMNPFPARARSLVDARNKERIHRMNDEYVDMLDELEDERERRKVLEKMSEEKQIEEFWFKAPVDMLNVEQIQLMHDTFLELHEALCDEILNRLRLSSEGTSSSAR